jgi:hypothetical protein
MKLPFALLILGFAITGHTQDFPQSGALELAVRSGNLSISSPQEMTRPFGQAGKWVFQGGRVVAANRVDRDEPVCEVTVGSSFQREMPAGLFRAGQRLGSAQMQMNSSNFNLGPWSRNRASFSLTFSGTTQDAARAGVTDPDTIDLAELMPGSLSVEMACRGFRTSAPTVVDLVNVVGRSVFAVATTPYSVQDSMRESVTGQRLQRERAAQAEARRQEQAALAETRRQEREARIQAEATRLQAEREARAQAERERLAREAAEREATAVQGRLTALGQVSAALPATFRVSTINDNAVVGISPGLNAAIINGANNRFLANIFQNGEHVGYVHQNGDLYSVNGKTIDYAAPYCRVRGLEYMRRPLTQQLDLQAGLYDVASMDFPPFLRSMNLRLEARDAIAAGEEGFVRLQLDCRNVETLADVQAALGAGRFDLRQPDAAGAQTVDGVEREGEAETAPVVEEASSAAVEG